MANDFLCDYPAILKRIESINPTQYARTRNFIDGSVTWLSPFITHGVITTKQVGEAVIAHHGAPSAYKFLSELGWREFFHRTWQDRGNGIFEDIKRPQEGVVSTQIPQAILDASTGIEAIDHAIQQLIQVGTMHNHARMWLSSLTCNISQTKWQEAAAWLHYHLLDGDLASNALSWQWIAGTFSQRKYIANQENINRYSGSEQRSTPVDLDYPELAKLDTPEAWQARADWRATLSIDELPTFHPVPPIQEGATIALHSIWNLSARWMQGLADRHILVIEPSFLHNHPISAKRIEFILHWAKQIPNIEFYHGEVSELTAMVNPAQLHHREYPACRHWPGREHQREWLYPSTTRAYASFSSYWKHAQKELGLGKK